MKCGENKPMALEECASCLYTPATREDDIVSIILCYSETEPYLNFLCLDEIEEIRANIIRGEPITIGPEILNSAEEAYSAVKTDRGPSFIQNIANRSSSIFAILLLLMLALLLI